MTQLKEIENSAKKLVKESKKDFLPYSKNIKRVIVSHLGDDVISQMKFSITSKENKRIVQDNYIKGLNDGSLSLSDLEMKSLNQAKSYFGNRCNEITRIDLKGLDKEDLSILNEFTGLEIVVLSDFLYKQMSIEIMNSINEIYQKIKDLKLENFTLINYVDFISENELFNDKFLLILNSKDKNILDMIPLMNLSVLTIIGGSGIDDWSKLSECQKLHTLFIDNYSKNRIEKFPKLRTLVQIRLENCNEIEDLNFLKDCQNLCLLHFSNCEKLKNLEDKDTSFFINELGLLNLEIHGKIF